MTIRRLSRAAFAIIAGLLLGSCYSHFNRAPVAAEDQSSFELARTLENIEFTRADWPQPLYADLHLPRKNGPLPVVITVHGGGWANRDRGDMTSVGEKLVQNGYAVFNISYRFAPRYTYPDQLYDLGQAMTWIAQNAQRYRLDTTRINAWGYSSGAHLAALVASYDSETSGHFSPSDLPRIRAVVAGGIPADLRRYPESPIIARFIGGAHDEMQARYAEASPVVHVSRDDPPTFLYHGKLDMMVESDQATAYYDALRAAGIETELYLHNWYGHIAMFLLGGDAEDRAIAFLDRHNQQVVTATRPRSAGN